MKDTAASASLPADDASPQGAVLAMQLRALAHPARLAMLERLAAPEGCLCGEVVRALPLAQSTVSQHLKVLVEAGLVRLRVEGARSCYCLDAEALARLSGDLDALLARLMAAAGRGGPTQPC